MLKTFLSLKYMKNSGNKWVSELVFWRVAHENKERRRLWAQRKTQPKQKKGVEAEETEQPDDAPSIPGMLPSNIVAVLAAREKYAFLDCLMYSQDWIIFSGSLYLVITMIVHGTWILLLLYYWSASCTCSNSMSLLIMSKETFFSGELNFFLQVNVLIRLWGRNCKAEKH